MSEIVERCYKYCYQCYSKRIALLTVLHVVQAVLPKDFKHAPKFYNVHDTKVETLLCSIPSCKKIHNLQLIKMFQKPIFKIIYLNDTYLESGICVSVDYLGSSLQTVLHHNPPTGIHSNVLGRCYGDPSNRRYGNGRVLGNTRVLSSAGLINPV
eukprot:sb/3473303/